MVDLTLVGICSNRKEQIVQNDHTCYIYIPIKGRLRDLLDCDNIVNPCLKLKVGLPEAD